MKTTIVKSDWIQNEGHRLDCGPYIGGAIEIKYELESLKGKSPKLKEVVASRFGGIYHAGRYKRLWLNDEAYGVPFLSSRDVMQSDLSKLNLIATKSIVDNPKLLVHRDQILITRSGTIGRLSYANSVMEGMSCTEHVIKVEADSEIIQSGYLYAFLNTHYGVPLIVAGTYGAVVRHIEPEHIADMPIPRLGSKVENAADRLIKASAVLRSEFQTKIDEATALFFKAAGLKDITPNEWHSKRADVGY
ncbi:MAG: hypothetical protein ACI8WB_005760, partial [Phenylobacterium sp.]